MFNTPQPYISYHTSVLKHRIDKYIKCFYILNLKDSFDACRLNLSIFFNL